MHSIEKQLDKKDKEFPKQISKNVDNKKIPQTEKKTKIRRKNYTSRSKRKFST